MSAEIKLDDCRRDRSVRDSAKSTVLVRTSQTTFAVLISENTEVFNGEGVGRDRCPEALSAIPSHVPSFTR